MNASSRFPTRRAAALAIPAALGLLAGSPGRLQAIPNQIGVGFINLAGMHFEDFAALPATWQPGARLKATWEPWKAPEITDTRVELSRLTVPATIFGLPAAEVTVQRIDDLPVRFDAVFQPARGASLADLERTLRRNLATWADDTATDHYRAGAARLVVTPRPASGDLVVTFTPAPPAR